MPDPQQACCILGGCGCPTTAKRVEALAAQLEEDAGQRGVGSKVVPSEPFRRAARGVLERFILLPRSAFDALDDEPGGAA